MDIYNAESAASDCISDGFASESAISRCCEKCLRCEERFKSLLQRLRNYRNLNRKIIQSDKLIQHVNRQTENVKNLSADILRLNCDNEALSRQVRELLGKLEPAEKEVSHWKEVASQFEKNCDYMKSTMGLFHLNIERMQKEINILNSEKKDLIERNTRLEKQVCVLEISNEKLQRLLTEKKSHTLTNGFRTPKMQKANSHGLLTDEDDEFSSDCDEFLPASSNKKRRNGSNFNSSPIRNGLSKTDDLLYKVTEHDDLTGIDVIVSTEADSTVCNDPTEHSPINTGKFTDSKAENVDRADHCVISVSSSHTDEQSNSPMAAVFENDYDVCTSQNNEIASTYAFDNINSSGGICAHNSERYGDPECNDKPDEKVIKLSTNKFALSESESSSDEGDVLIVKPESDKNECKNSHPLYDLLEDLALSSEDSDEDGDSLSAVSDDKVKSDAKRILLTASDNVDAIDNHSNLSHKSFWDASIDGTEASGNSPLDMISSHDSSGGDIPECEEKIKYASNESNRCTEIGVFPVHSSEYRNKTDIPIYTNDDSSLAYPCITDNPSKGKVVNDCDKSSCEGKDVGEKIPSVLIRANERKIEESRVVDENVIKGERVSNIDIAIAKALLIVEERRNKYPLLERLEDRVKRPSVAKRYRDEDKDDIDDSHIPPKRSRLEIERELDADHAIIIKAFQKKAGSNNEVIERISRFVDNCKENRCDVRLKSLIIDLLLMDYENCPHVVSALIKWPDLILKSNDSYLQMFLTHTIRTYLKNQRHFKMLFEFEKLFSSTRVNKSSLELMRFVIESLEAPFLFIEDSRLSVSDAAQEALFSLRLATSLEGYSWAMDSFVTDVTLPILQQFVEDSSTIRDDLVAFSVLCNAQLIDYIPMKRKNEAAVIAQSVKQLIPPFSDQTSSPLIQLSVIELLFAALPIVDNLSDIYEWIDYCESSEDSVLLECSRCILDRITELKAFAA